MSAENGIKYKAPRNPDIMVLLEHKNNEVTMGRKKPSIKSVRQQSAFLVEVASLLNSKVVCLILWYNICIHITSDGSLV